MANICLPQLLLCGISRVEHNRTVPERFEQHFRLPLVDHRLAASIKYRHEFCGILLAQHFRGLKPNGTKTYAKASLKSDSTV